MRKKFLFLFFLSGLSALIYEVLWMKLLSRTFGVTSFATGTVLSVFMLGLAVGSFYFGRLCREGRSPLKLYILMELGIGVSALIIPNALHLVSGRYGSIYSGAIPSFMELSIYRFLGAFFILIIPTTLMGGTLPVLNELLYKKKKVGANLSLLYSLNTFGAVLGAVLSAFFLIENLGIAFTGYFAVTINALIVFIAALSPAVRGHIASKGMSLFSFKESKLKVYVVLAATMVSGFAALGLEVVWTRIFSLIFNNTTYAFSTILATFLFGIAAGSLFLSAWIEKRKKTWILFGLFQVLAGVSALMLIPFFGQIFLLFKKLGGDNLVSGWVTISSTKFIVCFVAMIIPTFMFGAAFPMGCKVLESVLGKNADKVHTGSIVGIYSGFNTVGAVLGAFIVPFVLIPKLGSQETAIILFYMITGTGVIVAFFEKKGSWSQKLLVFAVAAGFVVGCVQTKSMFDIMFHKAAYGEKFELIFSVEDHSGLTEILVDKIHGNRKLVTNRHQQEGDSSPESVYSQMKQGYLPFLLKPDVERVAVIGLGTGISLSPVPYFLPTRADCFEISNGIIEAARVFESENQNILNNPRLNIIREDGRNFLTGSDIKYDLIVADLFTPYRAAVGDMYSLENYRMSREKLVENGMFVQWLPIHQLSLTSVKIIAKTFITVFPHSSVWVTRQSIALIGQKAPFSVDFEWMLQNMQKKRIAADLRAVGLNEPYEFLASFLMGERELKAFCAGARINTDDMPIIEYLTPKEFDISRSDKTYFYILDKLVSAAKGSKIPFKQGSESMIDKDKLNAYIEARKMLYSAKIAKSKKRYSEALELYKKAWKIRPEESEAAKFLEEHFIKRGNDIYRQGFTDEGIKLLKEAILYNPHSTLAPSNIATIYFVNHDYDRSIKWWNKVLEIAPNDFSAKQGIKEANERKKFFSKTEEELHMHKLKKTGEHKTAASGGRDRER